MKIDSVFSITYKEVTVSWSFEAADYLKGEKGLEIREKAYEFLVSLDKAKKPPNTGRPKCRVHGYEIPYCKIRF